MQYAEKRTGKGRGPTKKKIKLGTGDQPKRVIQNWGKKKGVGGGRMNEDSYKRSWGKSSWEGKLSPIPKRGKGLRGEKDLLALWI